jgi:N-acetylmuramoyl-L-alanine amidase
MSIFVPDSSLVDQVAPSPNHEARKGAARPDILLLHYTGMNSAEAALRRLCDPQAGVSSHYVVFEDGRIFQLVPEKYRAYHAGVSSWEGESDVNSRSIGIEIGNQGHDYGSPEFPEAQMAAVVALSRDIVVRWSIAPHHVLAHSDVAPARKRDPGESFPWRRLAEAGVGLWVEPEAVVTGGELAPGAWGPDVAALQQALSSYGYGIDVTGIYDETTRIVVAAFQRHFRPARIDGVADRSTMRTLSKLIEKKSSGAPPEIFPEQT